MSDLGTNTSIPKNVETKDGLDYSFLRGKGLEYIEKLSGNLWTDYNTHDPGITMLEVLCYAITDLGMRMEMPIENILAPEDKTAQKISDQFFRATQILPSKPVTKNDYRKLFIDIEGVKNCWLKPFEKTVYLDCKNDKLAYNPKLLAKPTGNFNLQGLYSITVDFDALDEDLFPTDVLKEKEYNRIKALITERFHANRNLCEDLAEINKVEVHPISVCASIDVLPEADEELVHAKVLRAIDNYFSPSLRFFSLKQMFDKGYTSDQIFEGPLLANGFIDPKELEAAGLRTEVRLSDIMQLIMNVEGVNFIKDISINNCKNPTDETDSWLICVEPGKKPVRCTDSAYSYYKGVLPVNVNQQKVEKYLDEMEQAEKAEQALASLDMEIAIPSGTYLNTRETTTVQNDFPDTYGIGPNGLPSSVGTIRKSQARQLKGYLLFFDQILASYFAHLEKVKDLLSVDNRLKKTYFTQAVSDIADFGDLISNYPKDSPGDLTDLLFAELDHNIERKNRLLDHLIARFAERFSDYTFLMKQLYGDYASEAILHSKENFLKDYDVTSRQRGSAFNYYEQPDSEIWDTGNVAGVQKRISRLSGMKNYFRRNLSPSFVEIYDLTDSEGNKVYRWRIRNTKGDIILSATENYVHPSLAEDEMYLAVVKIIETSPETIKNAFKKFIPDESETGNFEIQLSDSGKYSFDIINLEAPANSSKRIIARQFTYYDTQEELKKAIMEIIEFMTKDFSEEGMFLVEHILLRPDISNNDAPLDEFMPICTDNCTSCQPVDPYSYRISVVLPGWTYRFANPDFRNFMEELIRKELPAHILALICWIGYRKNDVPDTENEMLQFEKAWKEFLLAKTKADPDLISTKLKSLNSILSELNSIYPTGRLIDCDDETDSLKGRIILGRTYIGNL
ncbi:MAG: hypothetical protein PHP53_00990 [Prolixibacteraceae bacterium]|nr:hypothetical protein [Prolixibacteraceae bacterium]